MASSTQKKTTTKKSGSRSGSRTAKGKQPQKRPIRREVGGVILLVLALCVLVSYCGVQAILIDLLAKLLKGLFGYGYWLAGPAMLLAGGILLLHRGRPVTLRATCALLLPLLAGALFHTIFAGGDYALNGWGVLKNLWTAGLALKAGGAVSGLLAEAAVLAVSKVVSLFLFGLLLAVLLLAALHVTPSAVLEMVRNRPEYEEEPEPTPAVHIAPAEPPRRRGERQSRPAIDIPLDGEKPPAQPEEESGRLRGALAAEAKIRLDLLVDLPGGINHTGFFCDRRVNFICIGILHLERGFFIQIFFYLYFLSVISINITC